MPVIRVSKETKKQLELLANDLHGDPRIRHAKHNGQAFVSADQIVSLAVEALKKATHGRLSSHNFDEKEKNGAENGKQKKRSKD